MLRKWIRGTLISVSIFAMFIIGLALKGKILHPQHRRNPRHPQLCRRPRQRHPLRLRPSLRPRPGSRPGRHRRLRNEVHRRRRLAQHHLSRRCSLAGHREEALVTISHFGAVLLFSLFTSVVFGITQRSDPRMMIRFGAFCFALFVGGTIVASWVMWLIKH